MKLAALKTINALHYIANKQSNLDLQNLFRLVLFCRVEIRLFKTKLKLTKTFDTLIFDCIGKIHLLLMRAVVFHELGSCNMDKW